MPLRSVEAASRDDAIAAAREQFGPHARVVGVRRVRSGGVLGFFATERYVAEVAPDQFVRPGAPSTSTGPVQATPVAAYDSPLAAAAPARARSTAPARNGAAAWAAEAARPVTHRSSAPRTAPAAVAPAWSPAPAARPAGDDERIDELAGLLGGAPGGSPAPAAPASGYGRPTPFRATFPSTSREAAAVPGPQPAEAPVERPSTTRDEGTVAPSPFTAALARMVSGDRDVRQAVDQALAQPVEPAPGAAAVTAAPVGAPAARPSLAAAIRSADPSMRSQAVQQEESTVREQATAPPSTSTAGAEDPPTWTAEPQQPATPASSARQEEIAEALRDALAQGHSDEALAGILRAMLAGDSPREALAEPVAVPDEPVTPVAVPDEPVIPVAVLDEPAAPAQPTVSVDVPVLDAVGPTGPAAADLLFAGAGARAVAPTREPVVPASSFPLFDVPAPPAAPAPAPADLGGGGSPADIPLWGEPVPAPPAADDAPIWADVLLPAPAPAEEPVAETAPAEATAVEQPVVDEVVVAEGTGVLLAAELAEAAPLLARTASDPAPLSMSMDATTVMPRVSLLPPLPGARGRGLPPVPPSSGRPAVAPSRSATSGSPDDAATRVPEDGAAAAPAAPVAPATRALATVTRLPVGPLMAWDDHRGTPGREDHGAGTAEPVAADPGADTPVPAPGTPREVVARLTELGVPTDLLGEDIADRIEADGTYAALTHALATRLPEAPRLPTGAGEVLFVVGPGVETLRTARALAASLRLDPDRVQWATRGDLAGLAPKGSRMTTIDAAIDRRQEAADAGTLTIVAVDAPLRSDVYWMSQMLAIWSPVAVWAVVEATRKPEDLELWLDGLARVDALAVQDTDLSADPAAVLQRLTVPVALLDGVRATPHRWASLLCERLDSPQA